MVKANRLNFICIVIFLLSLGFRILKMIIDPVLLRDSAQYLNMAEVWKNTGLYSEAIQVGTPVPPLPIFMIKALAATGLSEEMVGRGIALFLGSWIPVIGFAIIFLIYKRYEIAVITACILMFNPTLVSFSTQPMRENNYLFFQGIMFYFLVISIRKGGITPLVLCGLLCTASMFCRYEALESCFLCPIVYLIVFLYKRISLKRFATCVSVFLLSVIISSLVIVFHTESGMVFAKKIPNYFTSTET